MSSLAYPDRLYLLSDTYGSATGDPLRDPDIDARITTDLRSGFTGLCERFDIFGRERVTDHVVRNAVHLHARGVQGTTGIFINSAPRTAHGGNGQPFYLAEISDQLRVVTTPLETLAAIRGHVRRLYHLPNQDNGLYGEREQFRSSFTPRLLATNHGLELVEDDPEIIPAFAPGAHVAYVDRFGNLVIFEEGAPTSESLGVQLCEHVGKSFPVQIGDQVQQVMVGRSLGEAAPGILVAYCNDGNIEVNAKWAAEWGSEDRLVHSGYGQFGKPKIGTKVHLAM